MEHQFRVVSFFFQAEDGIRAATVTGVQTCALLVLPSLEENCPMSILEAMAAGVAVVAANFGGVPDLIEEGVSGLLCHPRDPASMGAAVRRFLSQPDFAREVAANARQRAQTKC